MLDVTVELHREFLLAGVPGQKLFLALGLRPKTDAASARPPLSMVLVVDTSGSMREIVTAPGRSLAAASPGGSGAGQSKMDLVIAGLRAVITSGRLDPNDRIGLVKFDDTAEVLTPMCPASGKARLLAGADRLTQFSGGTQMGEGLRMALELLATESGSRHIVLLTDGQTSDEELVDRIGEELAGAHVPVTAIGFGNDWNENLLTRLTDRTQGRPVHVVPDSELPIPPSVNATELPAMFLSELDQVANEVVTSLALRVRTAKDVVLDRVTRVQPGQNEVDLGSQPLSIGNAAAGEQTSFILELTLGARSAGRIRVAQLGLTYEVPGRGFRGEVPPVDVVIELTANETAAAQINPDVMKLVQLRNVEALVLKAQKEALTNPGQATKTLEAAQSMTRRLGNDSMTRSLERALGELKTNKTLSPGTSKTLRIGAKTQVLRQEKAGDLPSDEEIRRMSGA